MRFPLCPLAFAAVAIALPLLSHAQTAPKAEGPLAPELVTSLQSLSDKANAELKGDILPFWIKNTPDHQRGGFYGLITDDMKVIKDAPRGMLLTARILWTYSSAYRRFHDAQYLELATWAYKDLESRFTDREFGGYLWATKADGTPIQTEKQIYGHSFAIYGLSEYYRATGDKTALNRAIELYRLIEQHSRDRKNGGYFDAFSRDWKPVEIALGSPGPGFAKSQNTTLHLMEAYANLLRAWPDEGLRKDLKDVIQVMITKILDPKTGHLILFQDADWTPRSDTRSFGHDIEANWLLTDAAEAVGDPEFLKVVNKTSLALAELTLAEGMDKDGSLFYESTPKGISDDQKEWWAQVEAIVGYINAYQISGDPKFLKAINPIWDFCDKYLIDHKNGEWYFRVDNKHRVVRRSTKVSMWKCPYHNSRACMEIVERLQAIIDGHR